MSKGCARTSKKACGGLAAGRAVRIDENRHFGRITGCSDLMIRSALNCTDSRLSSSDHKRLYRDQSFTENGRLHQIVA
jgi:hypothetical protein